jgi:SpoVK/Ycf46/Vps4 family AAA+-type ATPase
MSDETEELKELIKEVKEIKDGLGIGEQFDWDDDMSDEEEVRPGKLVQYQENAEGYAPTTKTITRLLPAVYTVDYVNRLLTFTPKDVKTDKLVKLPDTKSDEVLQRIKSFWPLKEEFKNGNEKADGGYLHKMGIFIHGPPGSGKTCTVKLIMIDIIERGGIVLMGDTNPSILAEGLRALRLIEPEKPVVVVFEDFDSLIRKFGDQLYLAILDGEHSIDNSLFIATTNYPDRFDPRIYNRPGRFNDVVKIGMPNEDARRMFLKLKLKDHTDVETIVSSTKGFSIDHLKALILAVYFEKKDLTNEIERLRKLWVPPEEDGGKTMGIVSDKSW